MPWWAPTALLSTSPPLSSTSPNTNTSSSPADSSSSARRQEIKKQHKKSKNPRGVDDDSGTPQPLPLPELSSFFRKDVAFATSKRLPSPTELPTRISEGAGSIAERDSRKPSRKAPENLTFVDVESNKFTLPCRSAPSPSSPYASPSLSPQRRPVEEMFPSYYKSPQKTQIRSAPETPFSDDYTGFPSPVSPEQMKYSPDSANVRCSNNHYSPNTRSPQNSSRNSSKASSPMNKNVLSDSSSSPQAAVFTNSHPLPLPPGASSTTAPLPAPAPAPASSSPQVPSRPEFSSATNWQKGKLIGRGTFGRVYVATNLQTGALCAMKEVELIPDDPKTKECMKQLEQEIKLLSQLQHPNIVQYYGSQIVEEKLYIFLEYVHPGAISKYIHDHCGAITEAVVRNFTRHILSGLAYLHSKKTVHRDIKGANLLVDSAGVVKLADFGMAKHLTGQAANLSLKGGPYWMAPELMQSVMQRDMKPDLACAVDIWSLGCTIIEMLNGKPPWSEYEGAAAMFKVMRESPPIPETLSPEGKDFLQCCFRRNPVERPSANALLDHPFLRNSQLDVQSCVSGVNAMKIKLRSVSHLQSREAARRFRSTNKTPTTSRKHYERFLLSSEANHQQCSNMMMVLPHQDHSYRFALEVLRGLSCIFSPIGLG